MVHQLSCQRGIYAVAESLINILVSTLAKHRLTNGHVRRCPQSTYPVHNAEKRDGGTHGLAKRRLTAGGGEVEGTISVSTMVGNPTVSVLIAAYNASGFLHRAVRSALAQTRAPLEVLIIDDASTDDTLAVANTLAAEDLRVRVLTLPVNSGPAASRNAGLNAAQGDWVAVLDADDAYLPSRLETLVSALAEMDVDIVLDNFLFFDAASGASISTALQPGKAIEFINLYDFLEHAQTRDDQVDWGLLKPMFRREFLNMHSLRYPEFSRHGEDFLLMFWALHAGADCMLVRNPGYLYSTRDFRDEQNHNRLRGYDQAYDRFIG